MVLLLAMAVLTPRAAADDAARHAEVQAMYEGYKEDAFPLVQDITPDALMTLQSQLAAAGKGDRLVIVDVRESREQAVSMLPGAVTEEAFHDDETLQQGTVVAAYCTISYRSGVFARKMAAKGIGVLNLQGGLLNWVHEGGTLHDPEGQPTTRLHVYGSTWDLAPERIDAVY